MQPDIPDHLYALMAEIGPKWGSNTRSHIAQMIDAFSALHRNAPDHGVRIERDIPYGPHERQRFEVFQPPHAATGRSAVIFMHGGAFTEGSRNRTDEIYSNVLRYFARHDIVGINAGYRLALDACYPDASRDIGHVVAWVHAQAASLGVDPSRIFLMGHSAGGAHVATYAYDRSFHPGGGSGLAGLIVVSGRVRPDNRDDNPNARRVEAYYGTDASLYDGFASIGKVDANSPPTFIALAQYENPLIDLYCLELAHRLAVVKGMAPPLMWLRGHNHTSIIGHIGTAEDMLGAGIRQFIADTNAATARTIAKEF